LTLSHYIAKRREVYIKDTPTRGMVRKRPKRTLLHAARKVVRERRGAVTALYVNEKKLTLGGEGGSRRAQGGGVFLIGRPYNWWLWRKRV